MLRTSRLTLRPLQAGDAPWIAREISDPEVQRWLTSPPHPYRLADARTFLAGFSGRDWCCAIEFEDAPRGVISIARACEFVATRPAEPELGYWLARDAWGQGLMTEAASALVARYFATAGAAEIHSGWIEGNGGSQRVLDKLGARRTGRTERRHAGFLGREVPVIRVRLDRPAKAACGKS